MRTKITDSFHPYALTAIVFWAVAYVFTRLALHHFSAAAVGLFRYLIASCVLVPLVLYAKIGLPRRADWPIFAAAGATGFFLYMLVFNKGCETMPAAASSLIIATTPVVTALMASIIYKEKLSLCCWLASLLELSGVALLTLLDVAVAVNVGVWWLLAAVLFFSAYNLLQRRLTKSYSALQTCAFSIFAGALMLAVFLPTSLPQLQSAPPRQLFYLLVMGVFSSAIAYVAWAKAFAKAAQTSSVSNYLFLTPALTSLLGLWLAGEKPGLSTLAGGSLILLGLALFNFGDKLIGKSRLADRAR